MGSFQVIPVNIGWVVCIRTRSREGDVNDL